MSLSIGIVGLPNVGKSTLFNALTKQNILAANYPFATIEPNTGIVPVPDERLEKLAKIYKPEKTLPATVKFVDIAGLVAGAHKGEGMGNEFLSHVREADAIAHVVRAFDDANVLHVADEPVTSQSTRLDGVQGADEQQTEPYKGYGEGAAQSVTQQSAKSTSRVSGAAGKQTGAVRALSDIDIINTELILADIAVIQNHLPKLEKQAKTDPKVKKTVETLKTLLPKLQEGQLAVNGGVDLEPLAYLQLITAKPFIYVFNIDEGHITDEAKQAELKTLAPTDNVVFVSAKIEAELAQLDGLDKDDLMVSYGLDRSGLEQLTKVGYQTLNLQSFLTAGPKEVRAWTIKKGATAPEAAGVIHTDFEKGFIAAQVVNYHDLIKAGSEATAKAEGKIRTEGKDYIMRPDDVVEFRFNV